VIESHVSLLFYLVYFITLVYITSYYNTNLIKISSPHLPRFFFCLAAAWEAKQKLSKCGDLISIRLFQIISIPSKKKYFHPPDHVISMEYTTLDFRCQCTQQKLQSICAVLTFDPQLNNILTFSVKDRYQLNYFICMKDFNAETITSLKLNLLSFFICGCQHHERKTICLYVYISDIRQTVRYRTPVFIQPFP
jgi:hypothetical protein